MTIGLAERLRTMAHFIGLLESRKKDGG